MSTTIVPTEKLQLTRVEPDMVTAAKGLGNGVPIGLTVAKPEIADSFQGITISTFGGNPVTSVTARAVIDIIEEDDLRTNAAVMGEYFRKKLEELQAPSMSSSAMFAAWG